MSSSLWRCSVLAALSCLLASSVAVAAPKASDALKYEPLQPGVEYDRPDADQVDQCTVKAEKVGEATAWVVRSPEGLVLRQFSDTNNDRDVDCWCYFSNGLEVYRDIDSDFDRRVDQCRWFHQAGTRWGLDRDQDGHVDLWKQISAEEAAEEAVSAFLAKDPKRFASLLLQADELKGLGFDAAQEKLIRDRLDGAVKAFAERAKASDLGADDRFTDFGGVRPGLIPKGSWGVDRDVVVYENVWAMVQDGDRHRQLNLGTMIRVGHAWKLIDAPSASGDAGVTAGLFYQAEEVEQPETQMPDAPTEDNVQEMLAELDALDQQIASAKADALPKLNQQRAELLARLAADAGTQEEQELWLKQIADTVGAAAQMGQFDGGVGYLAKWEEKLAEKPGTRQLAPYFRFQRMLAEYIVALNTPGVDYGKTQAAWIEGLEQFVKEYPKNEQCAEAFFQLALNSELSDPEAAADWYRRIVKETPESPNADKARGALVRLTSTGKPIHVQGPVITGGKAGLGDYRGKVVVVHYWATKPDVSKTDHAILKDLYSKFRPRGLEILGVNLDFSKSDALAYLKQHRLPWKQLYEPGGLESRLANEMGAVTVPLILLVDQRGHLVSSTLQADEVEDAVAKLLSEGASASRADRLGTR